ncbi:acVLRF1 family peptidyl-tRNA hydrolase [Nocardioides fonticola]|uniref:AcVLRF1 family peptidyl-tRNA hydrolase n=1 Tax=Nocardioides fonticola TaxID=450363 RepID=A0ABP7XUC9_9ACTN
MPVVLVPPARFERWVENFAARHGAVDLAVAGGALLGSAPDGSTFAARLPFDRPYQGAATPAALVEQIAAPPQWGVLLVRKGGFAVARHLDGSPVAAKVGRRHVQGRTKAGGQSQQRFARRRDNQAREAFEAAATHAVAVLEATPGRRDRLPVIVGGDRSAVGEVLADPRLAYLEVVGPWFDVPDPRRDVLDRVTEQALHLVVEVANADESADRP